MYDQRLYSVQVPDKIQGIKEKKDSQKDLRMNRNVILKALKQARKPKNLFDLPSNNKLANMVSTLLFYRICYSHQNVSKPTENSLMFNEGMFLPSKRIIKTTCDYPMTTTFPIFHFTVATKDHFEIINHPQRCEEVDQN